MGLKNIGDAQEVYRLMTQEIFPFIKNLKGDTDDTAFSRYMREAIFQINKPATLQKAISILDVFPTRGLDVDFDNDKQSITDIGDIYEYLLSKLSTAGKNGQFRTPRHIIDMMVELMQPTIKDIISDPAMGFRVIIMTQANSQVNTRVLELLPKFKIKKMNRWCAV